jgi:DNA-3-methyladenine glycosylase I
VIPEVIEHPTAADVFAVMTRAVFQAGVSWAQIGKNWDAYGRAFADFDAERVAQYNDIDIEQVLAEPGILRMPKKVKATIANAQALQAVLSEFRDFHAYISTFPDYAATAKDIKKRFSFMGDMNAWYLLFRLHEPVPKFEAWVKTIPGDHPRMREMVEHARSTGRSAEVTS